MHTKGSLIGELEEAVKEGSPEKRVDTLRRVTDLFLNEADRLNDQQISVFDDVLVHLIQRVESKALIHLSATLAPIEHAPIESIRRLARDKEISVAGPVLTQSKRLTDRDLIEIAESHGQDHLLAISGRSSLNTGVTDVLVRRGDRRVTHALAVNAGARFSDAGYATLTAKAYEDETLSEKLGARLDLPFKLLRELLLRATDAVKSRLLQSAPPEARMQIQRALASVVEEISATATKPRDFTASDSLVRKLNQTGKLTETLLLQFAAERRYEEMTSTLALFCQVRVELIESLMSNIKPDGLVVACKAANLGWQTTNAILKARFSHHAATEQELAAAKGAFLELSRESAQRTMRFMAVKKIAARAG